MRIPEHAKKVFDGVIFDVYQWEQEMFDGSKATFEMLKRPFTVEVIATQGDSILLSHQSQPTKPDFYSFFGGRGEENEEPLDAAKRELLEESGLQSDDWELFTVYEPVHKIDWQVYMYIARNCKKVADQKLDSGEKIEIIEYSFDEFLESDIYLETGLGVDILLMKQDPEKLAAFKQLLFKNL